MKKLIPFACAVLVVSGLTSAARAIPVLSIDLDPTTAGIQDVLLVSPGGTFDIDIVISDVEADEAIQGFELDLTFSDAAIRALAITPGSFLSAPTVDLSPPLASSPVSITTLSLLPVGATGSGLLATLTFEAIGAGLDTDLGLDDVVLTAPFGLRVPFETRGASVSVAPIPEPGAALLFGAGFFAVGLRVRFAHQAITR